jgi:metal-dependent amidase/aminoacylase/carboxypeptidase family protein
VASSSSRSSRGIAAAHEAEIDCRVGYPVRVNDAAGAAFCAEVAAAVVGPVTVTPDRRPEMGAEDFANMLQAQPAPTPFSASARGRACITRLRLQRLG